MTKDRLLNRHRSPESSWDAYESEQGVLDLYADGFHGMLVGTAVSKLSFYVATSIEGEEGAASAVETRVVKTRLTMPTRAIVEMFIMNLAMLSQHGDSLGLSDLFEKYQLEITLTSDEAPRDP